MIRTSVGWAYSDPDAPSLRRSDVRALVGAILVIAAVVVGIWWYRAGPAPLRSALASVEPPPMFAGAEPVRDENVTRICCAGVSVWDDYVAGGVEDEQRAAKTLQRHFSSAAVLGAAVGPWGCFKHEPDVPLECYSEFEHDGHHWLITFALSQERSELSVSVSH